MLLLYNRMWITIRPATMYTALACSMPVDQAKPSAQTGLQCVIVVFLIILILLDMWRIIAEQHVIYKLMESAGQRVPRWCGKNWWRKTAMNDPLPPIPPPPWGTTWCGWCPCTWALIKYHVMIVMVIATLQAIPKLMQDIHVHGMFNF